MSGIKAGVVFVSKFCVSSSEKFSGYIDYIDRKEAVRNENMYKFNLYNDYMGNPEKTGGLFTDSKDNLTDEDRKELKDVFEIAEENGSVMWQNVLSFDNRWLKENGMFNDKEDIVNSDKLKEYTRLSMMKLQKSEGLENAIWSAAIHYNTDNIHIHIAMVEPIPMREMKGNQVRGKLKLSSIEKAKSSVVNAVLQQQPENDIINNIIRNNIIENKKVTNMLNNEEFTRLFMQVHSSLPADRRLWNYRSNAIKDLIPLVDKMSDIFLEEFHEGDMHNLEQLLQVQDSKYKTAYGDTKNENRFSYADNKKKDLYYRLGNVILKEIKQFDYQEKRRIYNEAKESGQRISQDHLNLYSKHQLKHPETQAALKTTIELTKMFMKDECVKMRDQLSYQRMQSEIDYKNQMEEQENAKDK